MINALVGCGVLQVGFLLYCLMLLYFTLSYNVVSVFYFLLQLLAIRLVCLAGRTGWWRFNFLNALRDYRLRCESAKLIMYVICVSRTKAVLEQQE